MTLAHIRLHFLPGRMQSPHIHHSLCCFGSSCSTVTGENPIPIQTPIQKRVRLWLQQALFASHTRQVQRLQLRIQAPNLSAASQRSEEGKSARRVNPDMEVVLSHSCIHSHSAASGKLDFMNCVSSAPAYPLSPSSVFFFFSGIIFLLAAMNLSKSV